ncbi:hypothetical protein EPN44_16060 [bacterium]|nr:MAG: hypothetical protein EPN44_16060 [bacterium]
MARKATPAAAPAETSPLPEQQIEQGQQLMAQVAGSYADDRDLVNQLMGQIQMANSIAKFSDVVGLSKLKHIKETKAYRALSGKKGIAPDGTEISDVGTFEGFCRALGMSYSKVDEDLKNLATFGEEALRQLSAVGAGYRELRALRKLPEDERALIAAAPDRESLIELLEERGAAHAKEKEQLAADLAEAKADADAARNNTAERDRKISHLQDEVAKAKRKWKAATPDEQLAELQRGVTEASLAVRAALSVDDASFGLHGAVVLLAEHADSNGLDVSDFLADVFAQLLTAVRMVRDDEDMPFAVPVRRDEEA